MAWFYSMLLQPEKNNPAVKTYKRPLISQAKTIKDNASEGENGEQRMSWYILM